MKNIWPFVKKILALRGVQIALVIAVFVGCFLLYRRSMEQIELRVEHNAWENANLKKANDSLLNAKKELTKSYDVLQQQLSDEYFIDSILQHQVDSIDAKLKTTQSNYEKARHYADTWGSDSLRWYFSNLK